jgi:hypothetical protein
MSLNRSWDYNGKKLTVYYPVVNAYISGELSRDSFIKQVAPLLTHDPLVLIEILPYLDGFRKLMSHGKPVIETNKIACSGCETPRKIQLEDHREFSGVRTKYLINFEDCNCNEDYEDMDVFGDQ